MATANDIITDAARRINILAEGESLSAAALSDSLTMLNDMMHGFGPRGIRYVHTTLTATQTVNVPDELIDSLKWLMADAMCDDFGVVLSPRQQKQIDSAQGQFQAFYLVINPATTDPALRRRRWGFNDFVRGG